MLNEGGAMIESEEIWKPCYDNPLYDVSNFGRVRSYISRRRRGSKIELNNLPIIKKQAIDKRGYHHLSLRYGDGTSKNWFVHRLVALAFVFNPEPAIRKQVNHIDGNKSNNMASNLEWVTSKQNIDHAIKNGLRNQEALNRHISKVKTRMIFCDDTDSVYYGADDASKRLGVSMSNVTKSCSQRNRWSGGYKFRYCENVDYRSKLYLHQLDALDRLGNGKILVGTVGSGKSRTALAYFWQYECDRMRRPKDLYIITTARKRDSLDWQGECIYFGIDPRNENQYSKVHLVVDSWNNIQKYVEVSNAFFIFDEQRVVGYGAWTKNFLKITKRNRWLLLSGTPGDSWIDYVPVFIANGFYKNKTEFIARHVVYSRFSKFPKVEKYLQEDVLEEHKKSILVEMNFTHSMQMHVKLVECDFDSHDLMRVYRGRWNIYKNIPISHAGTWCYLMREVVNSHHSRLEKILDIFEERHKLIVFYNFDYELEVLKDGLQDVFERPLSTSEECGSKNVSIAEYNGHKHEPVPTGERWIYLVQYNAASEAWNCITTDTIVFYSLNYSYKIMEQASGRIRRMNSPYSHLYYYVLYSKSVIDKSILTALKNKKDFNAGRLYRKNFDKEEVK